MKIIGNALFYQKSVKYILSKEEQEDDPVKLKRLKDRIKQLNF